MSARRATLLAGLALTLSSCGDPNALTEDHIAEIIAKQVRLNPCIQFREDAYVGEAYLNGARLDMHDFMEGNEPFPITIRVGGFDEFTSPRYQEFERVGLLTSKSDGGVPGAFGRTDELRRYELTNLGRSMYQLGEKKVFADRPARKNPLFCAGKGQVSEVVNFTVPGEGANVTRVTFRWNTVDAGGNPMSALPDQPWVGISGPRPRLEGEDTAMLTLTNNGWEILK